MQPRLAVPCDWELSLQHPFIVESSCSLLHFDQFCLNFCTIFPLNNQSVLGMMTEKSQQTFLLPQEGICLCFFGDVLIFVCSEL